MHRSSPSTTPQWFSDTTSEGSATEVLDESTDEFEDPSFNDPGRRATRGDGTPGERFVDPPLQPEEVVRGCAVCNASVPWSPTTPYTLASPILVRSATDAVAALASFAGAADSMYGDHMALQALHRRLHEHAADLHRRGTEILRQGEGFAWYCDQRFQRIMQRLTESSTERRRLEEVIRGLVASLEDARAGRDRADALHARLTAMEAAERADIIESERRQAYVTDLESRVAELEQRRRQPHDDDESVSTVWIHDRDVLTPGPEQERLLARVPDLESQLAAREPYNPPLPPPGADLRAEVDRLRATVAQLQAAATYAAAEGRRARDARRLSRLRVSAAASEESVLKGRDARRILRQRIEDLVATQSALEADLRSVRVRLDTEQHGHDVTRELLRTVALEHDSLRSRCQDAKAVQDTLQAELNDVQQSRDALQQRLSLLITRLNRSPSSPPASSGSPARMPPPSSPIAVYSTDSSPDASPKPSSPADGSHVLVRTLGQTQPRSPPDSHESVVASTAVVPVDDVRSAIHQDQSALPAASAPERDESRGREMPSLVPSSRPTKIQRRAPEEALPVAGLPGTYRIPRPALIRGAPRRALRMHADPAAFFLGVDEPAGDVQSTYDTQGDALVTSQPMVVPASSSFPITVSGSASLAKRAAATGPVSDVSAVAAVHTAGSAPKADSRGARGRTVTFAVRAPTHASVSGGAQAARRSVSPVHSGDNAGPDGSASPSPSGSSSSSFIPSDASDTPSRFVSIPGARSPVTFLASEVKPWPVLEVSASFRGAVDVEWILKLLPISGWIFPAKVPRVTADPRLLTWSAISALYTTQPWDSMTVAVAPLTFDPLDAVFAPLVALYTNFVGSWVKALWEGTHHLAIPTGGRLDADLAAYVKRRKDRRSHVGAAWRVILAEIVDLIHRGYCDLDILLDPFFFHLAPRIKAREWHPVEDPRLPGSLVGSLAALDRADPWRLQYRADIQGHPAYQLSRLRGKLLRAPGRGTASP